jgi:DNA-binding transcriptional regulator YhcF (GntR family)
MNLLHIHIDQHSKTPAYKQIADQVIRLVKSGHLAPGAQVPAERDLSAQLGVARGTVKKAYETLEQSGVLMVAQGRGSFIAPVAAVADQPLSRKDQATADINRLIRRLEDLKFSYREMRLLFDTLLEQREESVSRFSIAAVDCNPEALEIYQRQIAILTHMNIGKLLLPDLRQSPQPHTLLEPYDLIVSTATHIDELRQLAPGAADKMVQVMVAPSSETLVALSGLKARQTIGILHRSERFYGIVLDWLRQFKVAGPFESLLPSKARGFGRALKSCRVLITPPGFGTSLDPDQMCALQTFRESGGRIIPFEYQIERGSLLYLEECLKRLLAHSIREGTQHETS